MSLSRRSFLIGAAASIAAVGLARLPLSNSIGREIQGEHSEYRHDIVYVYIEADLPDPIEGVITLAPNTEYRFMNTISSRHALRGPGPKITYTGVAQ